MRSSCRASSPPAAASARLPAVPTARARLPLRPVLDALFGRFWPETRAAGPTCRRPGRRRRRPARPGSCCPTAPAGLAPVPGAGRRRADRAPMPRLHRRHARSRWPALALRRAAARCPSCCWTPTGSSSLCLLAGAVGSWRSAAAGAGRLPGFVLAGIGLAAGRPAGLPWLGRTRAASPATAAHRGVLAPWSGPCWRCWSSGCCSPRPTPCSRSWVDAVLPDLTLDTIVLRVFVAVAVAGPVLAAAYLALNPPRADHEPRPPALCRAPVRVAGAGAARRRGLRRLPGGAADASLFGGHDYVQRTTGLTYADYVHQGFGQLTVATLLTLLVVWAAARKAPARQPRGSALAARRRSGLLCALTLVVVGSALHRMHLYQEAYGFTRLRLLVDVFEGWLGIIVVAVAVAGLVHCGRLAASLRAGHRRGRRCWDWP